MQLPNPLLDFDFNTLTQGYGDLYGMPDLMQRGGELQPMPQLPESGFTRTAPQGPVYSLAPQTNNSLLLGDSIDGYGGGYMGDTSQPGNVSLGDVGMAMAGMAGASSPLGLVGAIAGVVGQSLANTNASNFQPSLLNSLLGIKGPDGVNFGEIDALGLGFGEGGSGYGSDSPGGLAGSPGGDPSDQGMGVPGGDTSGFGGYV